MKNRMTVLGIMGIFFFTMSIQAVENLVKNGDFSQGSGKDIPGWKSNKAVIETVDGKPTLALNGSYVYVKQIIKLKPEWKMLKLTLRMKATELQVGNAGWKDGRIAMTFKNDAGKKVGGWPNVFHAKGTTDWIQCKRNYDIPEGAVTLELTPTNFGTSGKFEVQDIKLSETKPPKGDPSGKPIVILKLDDLTSKSQMWQKVFNYLQEQNLKAGFGMIGNAYEKDNPKFFEWVKSLHNSGRIEIWNHGYKNRTGKDKMGEFESDSVEEQLKSLQRTQQLAKEKLGITLHAFGPHWSSTNAKTIEALKSLPDIKCVFFYTQSPDDQWFVFQRYMNLEIPTFVPNFEAFKKKYEAFGHNKPYICLQGHPNAWSKPERWENFTKIIQFLKAEGCKFMTPSEYLAFKDGK